VGVLLGIKIAGIARRRSPWPIDALEGKDRCLSKLKLNNSAPTRGRGRMW